MYVKILKEYPKYKKYIFRVLFPVLSAVLLFLVSMFVLIIPSTKKAIFEQRKAHVKELTETAWGILYAYFYDEVEGRLSTEEAQFLAKNSISRLRYGKNNKEYFWIIDTVPVMIMHPYREDLIGESLIDYQDKNGKKLFSEAVEAVDSTGDAFISYMWQWHDDSTKVLEKTSYVKLFKPWGWIIGTGIYLFDVRFELKKVTTQIFEIAGIVLFIVLLLMIFVLRQALKIEQNRQETEKQLRKARDQYQALAEANPEGSIIVFDDNSINLNKNMQMILGYKDEEIPKLSIYDIILQNQVNAYLGEKYFRYLILGVASPKQFEANIKRKDGSFMQMFVTCSRIQLPEKMAVIITAKDIAIEKIVLKQLNVNREKYRELFDIVHLGIMRASYSNKKAIILNANNAFLEILSFNAENDIIDKDFFNSFTLAEELNQFIHYLSLSGFVRNTQIKLNNKSGHIVEVIISALLIPEKDSESMFLDILIHDRSNEIKKLNDRDKLLVELQTSYLYLNTPLENIFTKVISCQHNNTIGQIIQIMIEENTDVILVKENERYLGVITDHDLRDRVLYAGLQNDTTANMCMSSPLITLHETSTIYEAMLLMQQRKINHIAIRNSKMDITGMLSVNDILKIQQSTSSNLITFIKSSAGTENWSSISERVHTHVGNLLMSGANVEIIQHFITNICDVVIEKLCEWAIEKYGEPPVYFCFVALGSQGRAELSLKTDQDNAIIFNDVKAEMLEQTRSYFLNIAESVCYGLETAGFELCQGGLMAMNAKWCLSLSEWKNQFSEWINLDTHDEIFEFTAFFDMRSVFGDSNLLLNLKNDINRKLMINNNIIDILSQSVKSYKPPLNIFGKFITEKTSKHAEAINIKKPVQMITDLMRILSLRYSIFDTNTFARIEKIISLDDKNRQVYIALEQALNYLGLIRIKNQIDAINKSQTPDNYLNPRLLSEIDVSTLKKVLSEISISDNKLEI